MYVFKQAWFVVIYIYEIYSMRTFVYNDLIYKYFRIEKHVKNVITLKSSYLKTSLKKNSTKIIIKLCIVHFIAILY